MMLMLAAFEPSKSEDDASACLGLRFGGPNDIARLESLLIKQIRSRFARYRNMKPKQIQLALRFDVYEVPDPPRRGGFPKWIGESGWYK